MSLLEYIFPLSSPHLFESQSSPNNSINQVQDNQDLHTNTSTSSTNSRDYITINEFLQDIRSQELKKCVIVGPDRADKTSLVFQAAVSAAATGSRVTYICTHPLKRLPCSVHGMITPEPGIMNNVDLLYLEKSKELLTWLASMHTKTKLPSFIVIEDILNYATQIDDQKLERSLAKLCAAITDTAAWLAANNDAKTCHVVLTAPTRVFSMCPVLSLFHFKTLVYKGPEKDYLFSELKFECDHLSIKVSFSRPRDCIIVNNVSSTKTISKTIE